MPDQSVTHYVNVTTTTEGTGPQPAGFGKPMFLHTQDSIGAASRLHGPFTSPQGVLDFGYASGSPPHVFAQAVESQQPRVSEFYIGRGDTGDADVGESLEAITAANPGAWYCVIQESKADQDILDFAAAIPTLSAPKIGIVQSSAASLLAGSGRTYTATVGGTETDGDYSLTFTGFGLGAPVVVTTTRAGGTPATSILIAAALEAALDTAAAGSLSTVLTAANVTVDGAVITMTLNDGLASGTIVGSAVGPATLVTALTDADVGTLLQATGNLRVALIYHDDDSEYVDAAWAANCLSYNLDVQKGIWAYRRLINVPGVSLSDAQITNLRNVNANYFSPAVQTSGVPVAAFTAQGYTVGGDPAAGRRIDITTSLDWASARIEEAFLGVLLRSTHGVPFTDAGINKFAAALRGVFGTGIAAGHFLPFIVPEGEDREGTQTPAIFAPKLSEVSVVDRTARTLTFSALAYLREAIERVVFNLEVRR